MGVGAANDEAAAVEKEEGRGGTREVVGGVNPERERAARAGEGLVADVYVAAATTGEEAQGASGVGAGAGGGEGVKAVEAQSVAGAHEDGEGGVEGVARRAGAGQTGEPSGGEPGQGSRGAAGEGRGDRVAKVDAARHAGRVTARCVGAGPRDARARQQFPARGS